MDASILHIRPRFSLVVDHSVEEMMRRLHSWMDQSHPSLKCKLTDHHVVLDVVEKEVRYWSPQMSFRVEESDDGVKSLLKGMIGPRPQVWTLFMFVYFSLGILGFVVFCFGASRWLLGEFSYLVLALPIAFIFMLTAYYTSRYGQKKAHDQVEMMKDVIRGLIA